MKIVREIAFDGAEQRIKRLNLRPLVEEVRCILKSEMLRVRKEKYASSGAELRKLLDSRFEHKGGWSRHTLGASTWKKCAQIDGMKICLEVDIQVSGRGDLVVTDIYHLRQSIQSGDIDLGILVVPSDRFAPFLTSGKPSLSQTQRVIEDTDARLAPILLIAVEHDGIGPALRGQLNWPG